MSVFFKRRAWKLGTAKVMSELADQYHEAHKVSWRDLQNGKDDRKCFVCQGNHLARNCPKQITNSANSASAQLSDRNWQQTYVRGDDSRGRHDGRGQIEMSFKNTYHRRSEQMSNACLGKLEKCHSLRVARP